MTNSFIVPSGFEVSTHEDGEAVRLNFQDDQANGSEIILAKSSLPLLISELQKKAPEPLASMPGQFLQPGGMFSLTGTGVAMGTDGGVVLTLHIQTQKDRGVTLPLVLSAKDRDGLVSQLMAFEKRV
jgi:hypothetical protein